MSGDYENVLEEAHLIGFDNVPYIIPLFTQNNPGDNMLKIKKNLVFFVTGGLGYGGIELLWRGHTHWAMLVAGGICFMIFLPVSEKFHNHSLLFKASVCAICITGVEIIFGVVFNIILKQNIWDYSDMPLNFMGQICPLYTLFWGILSYVFIPLAEKLDKKLQSK